MKILEQSGMLFLWMKYWKSGVKTYDWLSLIEDIKENGLKEMIEVANYKGSWVVLEGQHRIRVFKHLNPPETIIKVIQKSIPCSQ